MSQPTQNDPHAAGTAREELSVEIEHLQAERLRLEIRDLRLAWWQRPAWLAACATIFATLCGLLWAATTQYFETRIRELKLETKDFQAGRDTQSQAFDRERANYKRQLSFLKAEEARLLQRLDVMDVPSVTRIYFQGTFWRSVPSNTPEIVVTGTNFGDRPGQLDVKLNLRIPSGGKPLARLTTHIVQWQSTYIIAKVDGLDETYMRRTFAAAIKGADPKTCMIIAPTTVHRPDNRESPFWYEKVPELYQRMLAR